METLIPGMYTVRVRATERVLSHTNRRYGVVKVELLEIRAHGEGMLVGETYSVVYNVDSVSSFPGEQAVKFIDALNREVGLETGLLHVDDILHIFHQDCFKGRVLDLLVMEKTTKTGKSVLVHICRSSQPDIGTMVRYTHQEEPFREYAAIVSRVLRDRLILHVLDPEIQVRVVVAKRSFDRAGTPQAAGCWSWAPPVKWN